MPPVRSLTSERHALLVASISLDGEIISPCSYYAKKGLIYIIIAAPFSHQPSSCFEYTKVNMHSFYNVRLVSTNKYIFSVS